MKPNISAHDAMRLDWQVCMNALQCAQNQLPGRQSWLDAPIEIARQNSLKKEYPVQMHAWPTSFQATDSVIVWREAGKILLGRKPKEPLWRFPGGFVDPADQSLELASQRERKEECKIGFDDDDKCICSHPFYIGSFRVPDPRYEGKPDRIMSAVFGSYYVSGVPEAGDDLNEVRWFTKDHIRRNRLKLIMPCHIPLVDLLINKGYL